MALTHLIQYNEHFKAFFKERIPKKREFNTISGHSPFSKEYVALAPYNLEDKYNASIVGTAFDYLARWIIANIITNNKEQAYTDLIAEEGVYRCQYEATRLNIDLEKEYNQRIATCQQYINGTGNIEDLIETSIFFAKLEQVFRRQLMPFQIDMDFIFSIEEEIVNDLKNLLSVFQETISDTHIVNENSTVIFNPTFGGASYICGGADADIYIDGVLYDFKCTNKTGYAWNETAQIYGYFLLSNVAKYFSDTTNMLHDYDIHRIAFYRARYGEIEYFDINIEAHTTSIQEFIHLIGEDDYETFFEQQRKWEEEETAENLKNENIIDCYNKIKEYLGCSSGYIIAIDESISKCTTPKEQAKIIQTAILFLSNERIKDTISGTKLKAQMDAHLINVSSLAKLLNMSSSTIRNWINEKNNPNVVALIKMTQIFGCSVSDLITKNNSRPTNTIKNPVTTNKKKITKKKSRKNKIKKRKMKKYH